MARRVRVEEAGFHYIYNRGVEQRVVFNNNQDKDKFLDIVCEVSLHCGFTIHAYALMDNHYHLLLENKKENLSHGMRRINSSYAQYFNKKYKRVGHLWQDRFKSWYIFDNNYLFVLFKYLEFNPLKAKLSENIGKYPYTILYNLLNDNLRECMKNSFILQRYDSIKELLNSLDIEMTSEELDRVEEFQKKSSAYKTNPKKITQKLKLGKYLRKNMSKEKRNKGIMNAFEDGFMQSEIARFLKLSDARVSRIIKELKVKT